ncbi:MAG: methylase domain protein [Armatimonadetes bacterium]|nr:methylase domain protein [Armatimonadota bacterium]
MIAQLSLDELNGTLSPSSGPRLDLETDLERFCEFGTPTLRVVTAVAGVRAGAPLAVPTYVNEFWTSKQRAASSLHEVSYRACFKPQLPRFFIERLTAPGDVVYDPFMGRGTTPFEAALLGRIPYGCDVNPLSRMLTGPRLEPPTPAEVAARLNEIDFSGAAEAPEALLVFYHPDTLRQIVALRAYLLERAASGGLDAVDRWIRLVAINRLTGHSAGFFSVYTLPPNQAVSPDRQRLINEKRNQVPPVRDVAKLIVTKTRSLLKDCDEPTRARLRAAAPESRFVTRASDHTPELETGSVSLVVTSPPFLDVVDYAGDNWLRCWFAGIDPKQVPITMCRKLEDWQEAMTRVFVELARVLKPGGHVAFEVGEVRGGKIRLEEAVVPCGVTAGLEPRLILINQQEFTKTANCWGVDNGSKGTNTNRIVLFRKR